MMAVLFYIKEHCGWVASGASAAPLRLYLSEGSPKHLGVPGASSRPLRTSEVNSAITSRTVMLGSWEDPSASAAGCGTGRLVASSSSICTLTPSPSVQLLSPALRRLPWCKASIGSFRQGHLHRMDHMVYSQPSVAEVLNTGDWRADHLNTSIPLMESAR